jgi:hypothetical protein
MEEGVQDGYQRWLSGTLVNSVVVTCYLVHWWVLEAGR